MQIKQGKKGYFWVVRKHPECDYIKPLHQAGHIIKQLDELCPECGGNLQLKQGNYGIFIGCLRTLNATSSYTEEAEVEEGLIALNASNIN